MTDTAAAPVEASAAPEAAAVPMASSDDGSLLNGIQPQETDYSFVLDKYRAEGRSDADSVTEQAKAYNELQGKFGAFTGAPDEYEFTIDENLADFVDLKDNPMVEEFSAMAKEMGINNEAASKLINLYATNQMAEAESVEAYRDDQLKELGPEGQKRLGDVDAWARSNLDPDQYEGFKGLVTDAASVAAVEAMISKTRNAPQVSDASQAPAISREELVKMQMAKDDNGNPLMRNPEYAAKVNEGYSRLFGDEPQRQIVG